MRKLLVLVLLALAIMPAFGATAEEIETPPEPYEFTAVVVQVEYLGPQGLVVRFQPSDYLHGLNRPFLLSWEDARRLGITLWMGYNNWMVVTAVDEGTSLDRLLDLRFATVEELPL